MSGRLLDGYHPGPVIALDPDVRQRTRPGDLIRSVTENRSVQRS